MRAHACAPSTWRPSRWYSFSSRCACLCSGVSSIRAARRGRRQPTDRDGPRRGSPRPLLSSPSTAAACCTYCTRSSACSTTASSPTANACVSLCTRCALATAVISLLSACVGFRCVVFVGCCCPLLMGCVGVGYQVGFSCVGLWVGMWACCWFLSCPCVGRGCCCVCCLYLHGRLSRSTSIGGWYSLPMWSQLMAVSCVPSGLLW
jgi:hypothetical protein